MRRAGRTLAPLLVALALATVSGCSEDEPEQPAGRTVADAPADASTEDYCAATDSLAGHVMSATTDRDAFMAGMKKWADEMAAVGTPASFSDEARSGFEQTVALLRRLDPQLDAAALAELEAGQSAAEKAAAAAFDEATVGLCGSPLEGVDLPAVPTTEPVPTPEPTPTPTPTS